MLAGALVALSAPTNSAKADARSPTEPMPALESPSDIGGGRTMEDAGGQSSGSVSTREDSKKNQRGRLANPTTGQPGQGSSAATGSNAPNRNTTGSQTGTGSETGSIGRSGGNTGSSNSAGSPTGGTSTGT